ncbi:hypothetical protein J3Q64DRAFT_1696874 [Phycomyces blakesleeanus]|uniref:Transmembrane protein n=1 Tax=Phycomyces blakesleeanus TaxID=4837 RepID=A0ABR3B5J8_PHYBL
MGFFFFLVFHALFNFLILVTFILLLNQNASKSCVHARGDILKVESSRLVTVKITTKSKSNNDFGHVNVGYNTPFCMSNRGDTDYPLTIYDISHLFAAQQNLE